VGGHGSVVILHGGPSRLPPVTRTEGVIAFGVPERAAILSNVDFFSSQRVAKSTRDALKATARNDQVIVAELSSIVAEQRVIGGVSRRACDALRSIVSGLPSSDGALPSTNQPRPVSSARMQLPDKELKRSSPPFGSILSALRSISSATQVPRRVDAVVRTEAADG
jgi:hypothetical protein